MRVCLIGCGSIACAAHGPALRQLQAEGLAQLVGCCDLDTAKAAEFASTFGFDGSYTDFEAMLAAQKPQLVFVMVPVRHSAATALRVLELGYPLVMEKPPGIDRAEAMAIIEMAKNKGLFQAVLFNRRSMPLAVCLREKLVGERIEAVSLEMSRSNRRNEDFTTTAIHGIDCLRDLIGSDYDRLQFEYSREADGSNVNYFVSGSFANGAHVDMRFVPCAGAVTERIAVFTAGGQYYLHLPVWGGIAYEEGFDCPGALTGVADGAVTTQLSGTQLSPNGDGYVLNGFYQEDKTILEAAAAGKPSPFPIDNCLQSLDVTDAMRQGVDVYQQGRN